MKILRIAIFDLFGNVWVVAALGGGGGAQGWSNCVFSRYFQRFSDISLISDFLPL